MFNHIKKWKGVHINMFNRRKILVVILVIFLIFLAGCSTNNGSNKPPEQKTPQSDVYVPRKAVPEGLPVYPDAVLINDLSALSDDHWQWLYSTTGSGNDIMLFFINALQESGFGIDSEYTIANYEEFFITTTDEVIRVYWLDSENLADVDTVTPDTPDRHYGIVVNLKAWNAN